MLQMIASSLHPFLAAAIGAGPEAPRPQSDEWERIFREASEHSLLHRLRRVEGMPAALSAHFRAHCLEISARNLALAGELRTLLRAFASDRLECAPLRGLALTEILYSGPVPRPSGDIDLVVRREDLPEVRAMLDRLGFWEMDRRPGFAETFSYTLKFVRESSFTVIVEPHWTIAYPPFVDRIDMREVWERMVPAVVAGEPTLSLAAEDLLLHLTLHYNHRDDPPLLWLWELDRFVRRQAGALRWEQLLALARRAGVGEFVHRSLGTAVASFETPVPGEVLGALDASRGRDAALPPARRLAQDFEFNEREGLALLLSLDGLALKWLYVRGLLFPSPTFMMAQYGLRHRGQLVAAYVRRFFRLTWDGVRGLARIVLPRRRRSRAS